jgi:DNA-binding transcriptional ArsR family regulator
MSSVDIVQSLGERLERRGQATIDRRDGSDELPPDAVFSILSNRRRRDVLRHLQNHGGVLSHGELAEFIAAEENGKSVDELTSKERKRIYVSLYQCHLPKMADEGVIEFERTGGTVELLAPAAQVERYLDGPPGEASPWWSYYLGIALGGGGFYGIGSFAFGPGDWLPVMAVAVMVLATVVVALTQWYRYRYTE